MDRLLGDLRHTLRVLRASPSLVIVSMLSLGLGIGVNLALFSFVRSALFYQPDVASPARVVGLEPGNSNQFSYLNYRDLRDSRLFEALAGFRPVSFNLDTEGDIDRIAGLAVTDDFFEFVGVGPVLGRTFTRAEAAAERSPRIAVLGYALWQQRFAGDPGVVGRPVVINGEPFDVIGVLPEQYRPVTSRMNPGVYVPLSRLVLPTLDDRANSNALNVLARPDLGMSRPQAQAALTLFGQRLARDYPDENAGLEQPARVVPLRVREFGGWQEPLIISGVLFLLVGLVLLSACANTAGLLLARTAHRQRELAVRAALGAGRARLMQMLLTESLGLAIAGAITGGVLFVWVIRALRTVGLPAMLGSVDFRLEIDGAVIGYALALTAAAGLLSGLLPAWRATRAGVVSEIQRGSGHASTGRLFARHAFVIGQVAASLLLLVLSSLLMRSFTRVTTLDPGFDVDRVAVAAVNLDATRYAADGGLPLAERVIERVAALPGVEAASVAGIVALGRDRSATRLQVEGLPADAVGGRTYINSVGPGYFATLGVAFASGRDFEWTDREGAPPVAIVNEAFARAYFPGQNALGKRIRRSDDDPFSEIVGIVRDTKYGSVAEAPTPIFYSAYTQYPRISTQIRPVIVHVRTTGAPGSVLPALRRVIADLEPSAFVEVQTLRDATGGEAQLRRFGTRMVGALGGVALLLAAIGLYGMIAFVVASRTREIGMRMALGASSGRILVNVLGQGLRLVTVGIAIGSVAAWLAATALAAALAGVSPADPRAYAAAVATLAVVAAGAIYRPARRAAALNPVDALRAE
jgi:putative ABC transport system permease protein